MSMSMTIERLRLVAREWYVKGYVDGVGDASWRDGGSAMSREEWAAQAGDDFDHEWPDVLTV